MSENKGIIEMMNEVKGKEENKKVVLHIMGMNRKARRILGKQNGVRFPALNVPIRKEVK